MTSSSSDLREFEQKSGGVACFLMPSERHVCCMDLVLIGDESENVPIMLEWESCKTGCYCDGY